MKDAASESMMPHDPSGTDQAKRWQVCRPEALQSAGTVTTDRHFAGLWVHNAFAAPFDSIR
jgi:hypothetical protein